MISQFVIIVVSMKPLQPSDCVVLTIELVDGLVWCHQIKETKPHGPHKQGI